VGAGVAWIVLGFVVLRFDAAGVAVVSVLVGLMALLAGFGESMRATLSRGGWRVWHVVLTALLLVAAVDPGNTFTSLALVIGFVFVYSGTFDVIWSLASVRTSPLWWLQLLSGLAQLVLGFFASSSIDAGAAVLLTYVSLTALSRGLSELVAGFTIRRPTREPLNHTAGHVDAEVVAEAWSPHATTSNERSPTMRTSQQHTRSTPPSAPRLAARARKHGIAPIAVAVAVAVAVTFAAALLTPLSSTGTAAADTGGTAQVPTPAATASAAPGTKSHAKPTIVLVHGAFADASSWTGVITRLQHRGYTVVAPANPLRSVKGDSDYLTSVLSAIPGPIVLVGHSYGGAVITNAANADPDVKALVYIAAFAPDKGETVGGLSIKYPGSQITEDNLDVRDYLAPGTDTGVGQDGYIKPSKFRTVFCADLSPRKSAVLAATQRPGSLNTLGEASGKPAWKTIPSWYLVAKQDHAIPPASERFMARRMKAHTSEINSSHVALISHPTITTDMIIDADRSTR